MSDSEELLQLNQRLLDAITDSDWAVYQELCDPTLTAFEPEAPEKTQGRLSNDHVFAQGSNHE